MMVIGKSVTVTGHFRVLERESEFFREREECGRRREQEQRALAAVAARLI